MIPELIRLSKGPTELAKCTFNMAFASHGAGGNCKFQSDLSHSIALYVHKPLSVQWTNLAGVLHEFRLYVYKNNGRGFYKGQ